MIYQAIRGIVRVSLAVFFKKMVVSGTSSIPDQGPLIIVSNHPNTLMDPLIIASITDQRIGFVANASIFTNGILIAIFRYFHVIPIFRKKDIAPGENPDNREAFSKCHEYLGEGKTLLIFPEGSSYYELKLREIKTGTARIGLSYEESRNFEGGLKILPVALDYSDSIQFRSMVAVTVNEPIPVSAYRDAYRQNEFDCVKRLTEDIRKQLAKNVPVTSGKEQENFLIKAHRFYSAYYEPGADLHENPKRSLELRKQLSGALHHVHLHNSALYQETEAKVQDFFERLKADGLTAGFLTDRFLARNRPVVLAGYSLKFLFLLPVYVAGLAANYLPYILPSKIFEVLKVDIEYKTSVELAAGLITFPLFYSLELWLFRIYVSQSGWHALFALLLFPITGYVAMYYWTEIKRFARVLRFYLLLKPERKAALLAIRDEILEKMAAARKSLG